MPFFEISSQWTLKKKKNAKLYTTVYNIDEQKCFFNKSAY